MDLRRNNRGVSLIELIVTLVILSILAGVVVPSTRMTALRMKELELKRNLRVIRTALDDFKKSYDTAVEKGKITPSLNKNENGYPKSLDELVEGFDFGGLYPVKRKFLRKVPKDPFAPEGDDKTHGWGVRSYADSPDSTIWGGEDVFDVYSRSDATAIDGTKYRDW